MVGPNKGTQKRVLRSVTNFFFAKYRGVGIIRTGIIRTALELSGQLFALTQYWNYRKVLGKKKIVLPGVLEKANQEIAAALLGYEEHEIAKKSKK